MPMRRRGRPGLMGTMARTAVVAGTATATAGAVSRHQAAKAQAAAPPQPQYEPAPPPAPMPAPAAPADDDVVAKLEQLAQLKAQGVLDDAEFAAAKARLLG